MAKYQRTVETFLEMVQVDSPSFSEKNMVDYLVKKINMLGWEADLVRQSVLVELYSEDRKRALANDKDVADTEQLIVTIPANDESKDPIYFCAHIDTVSPGRGIKPIIDTDKGIIYTDGTTVLGGDDKSGVASMVIAVDEILKNNIPHGKIVLLFTALEEKGHLGAFQVPIDKLGVKYGYVFDTTERVGRIMQRSQHGQTIEATITVKDIPNHTYSATVPNALSLACDTIAKIEKKLYNADDMTFTQVTRLDCEYEPGYMVPNKATFKVTTRSFDKQAQSNNFSNIIKLLDKFEGYNAMLTYRYSPEITLGYNHTLTADGKMMMNKADTAIRELGIEPEYITMGLGGHDSSAFIMKGIPSLVLSCGMRNIHTTSEYINIQDLHDCTALIIKLIQKA